MDVVLTGHDHAYSRTYLLEGGKKSFEYDDDSFEAQLEKDIDNGDIPVPQIVVKGEYSKRFLKSKYNDEPSVSIGVAYQGFFL